MYFNPYIRLINSSFVGNHQRVTLRFTVLVALSLFCAHASAQTIRKSIKSGNWSNRNTWDCNCVPASTDHAIVVCGHIVTFQSSHTIANLNVEQGAILTDNGLANTITGDLVLNGTYSGSGIISLTGDNTSIDGTGVISNSASMQITGNKTILSSARLTINTSGMAILGAFTITNYGAITVGGNISGSVAESSWINETNATLNVAGTSGVPLLAIGTLYAYAPGNTINYYATYAHTIKLPAIVSGYSSYHHLKISGTNTKTMPNGDVAINGDLTIASTLSGSGSSKKIYLRGNWMNNGNFTEGTGGSTVTFDGIGDQVISRAATENMNVIVVNKTSGKLVLQTNVIAERGLSLMAGDVDVKTYKLTLGLSPTIVGTFSWTSGKIIGKFERWISATGVPILFPIGTAAHDRTVSIQFNSLTPGSLITEFIAASPGRSGLPLSEDGVTLYNTFRDGYWSLTAANSLDTLNYNLDLTGNRFNGFTINDNTRLLTRASAVSPWSLHGSHSARVGNTIKRTNLSILSAQYSFGDDSNCTAPVTTGISGLTDVCTNAGSVIYSVVNNSPNTYSWNVNGGTVGSGMGTSNIMVNWGSAGQYGSVSVVEKNTCTEGAEISLPVNVHALPPLAIVGKANVPENGATAETYSVASLTNYSYTWSVTGGSIVSGQGTNTISVSWANAGVGAVCVVTSHSPVLPAVSCGQSTSFCYSITIYKVINSIRSGNWQTAINWDCSCVPGAADHITIQNTHTISLTNNRSIYHVNINAGGAINTNSNTLTVLGDFAVNGTLNGTGLVVLAGANTNVDGVGVIINTGPLNITSNKVILSNATLTKGTGSVTLGAGVVVTNQGAITIGGSLIGSDVNSQWINAANATLNIGGGLLLTGKLYASSSGNSIRYFGAATQNIKVPDAQQYTNLIISDMGAKVASAGVIHISGNFTNNGNFQHSNGSIDFNGNSQVSGNAITTFNHLSLQAGSSLTLPSAVVNISGNIAFAPGGVVDPSTGTVLLNGLATQQIDVSGANFFSLRINKTGGTVNVNSPLQILHLLDIQSTTPFITNDHLIIKSRGATSDLDASIGTLPANNLISGAVTVERYMNPIGNTFRYVASPVADVAPPAALGSFIYEYSYSGGTGLWRGHVSSDQLAIGKGYSVLMPGGNNPITWSVKSNLHQGEYTWNLNNEGWHLIGNPYASSIRWVDNSQAWTLTNISSTIAVTDNSVSGYPNYFRYWSHQEDDNPDTWGTGELQNGVVAMAQAFWVYVGAGGGTLTIKEPAKSGDVNGKFYRKKPEPISEKLMITLANKHTADRAYVKLWHDATNEFELRHDVMKLWNPEGTNLYLIDHYGNQLAIHALREISEDDNLPIGINVSEPGSYNLTIRKTENFSREDLYLVDVFEKQLLQVGEGFSYSFEVSDPDPPINDRFYLTNRKEALLPDVPIQVYPNPVKDVLNVVLPSQVWSKVSLLDAQGHLQWEGEQQGTRQLDLRAYPQGIYFLKVCQGQSIKVYKILK